MPRASTSADLDVSPTRAIEEAVRVTPDGADLPLAPLTRDDWLPITRRLAVG